MTQQVVKLSVTFGALVEAVQQLSLEDKLRLAAALDKEILREEEALGPDLEEEAAVEQARREYEAGDYVALDELIAEHRAKS